MGLFRFLLAIAVIAAHVGPIFGLRFVPGPTVVQTFFIISGFYMSLVLNEKYNSYWLFISNRLLRIYPTYFFILLLSLGVYLTLYFIYGKNNIPLFQAYTDHKMGISTLIGLGITNLTVIGQDILLFIGYNTGTGQLYFTKNFEATSPQLWHLCVIPPAWTLSVEIIFYFLAPFILKKNLKIAALVMSISIGLRIWCYYVLNLTDDPWTFRFFGNELFFFTLGNVSYLIYENVKTYSVPTWVDHSILIIVVFITLNYLNFLPNKSIIFQFTPRDIVYFAIITLSTPFLFGYLKDSHIDRFIGDLTFPIYLSHWLIHKAFWLMPFQYLKNSLSVAMAAIVLSVAIKLFVDVPVNRYREKRFLKAKKRKQLSTGIG